MTLLEYLVSKPCCIPDCDFGAKAYWLDHTLGVPLCFGHTVELRNVGRERFEARHEVDLSAVAMKHASNHRETYYAELRPIIAKVRERKEAS